MNDPDLYEAVPPGGANMALSFSSDQAVAFHNACGTVAPMDLSIHPCMGPGPSQSWSSSRPTLSAQEQSTLQHDGLKDAEAPRVAEKKGRRGKPPREWSSSWKRKIFRLLRGFPNMSIHNDIGPAVQKAGGPGYQTILKLAKETTGDCPDQWRLRNVEGHGEPVPELKVAFDAARKHDQPPSPEVATVRSNVPSANDEASPSTPPLLLADEATPSTPLDLELADTPEDIGVPAQSSLKRRLSQSHKSAEPNADQTQIAASKRVRKLEHQNDSDEIDPDVVVDELVKRTGARRSYVDFAVNRISSSSWSFATNTRESIGSFVTLSWSSRGSSRSSNQRNSARSRRQSCVSNGILQRLSREKVEYELESVVAKDIMDLIDGGTVTDINSTNSRGENPLHLGVKLGNRPVCGILLWEQVNPYARARNKKTPAANAGHALKMARKDSSVQSDKLHERIHLCRQYVAQLKNSPANQLLQGTIPTGRQELKGGLDALRKICDKLDTEPVRARRRLMDQKDWVKAGAISRRTLPALNPIEEQPGNPSMNTSSITVDCTNEMNVAEPGRRQNNSGSGNGVAPTIISLDDHVRDTQTISDAHYDHELLTAMQQPPESLEMDSLAESLHEPYFPQDVSGFQVPHGDQDQPPTVRFEDMAETAPFPSDEATQDTNFVLPSQAALPVPTDYSGGVLFHNNIAPMPSKSHLDVDCDTAPPIADYNLAPHQPYTNPCLQYDEVSNTPDSIKRRRRWGMLFPGGQPSASMPHIPQYDMQPRDFSQQLMHQKIGFWEAEVRAGYNARMRDYLQRNKHMRGWTDCVHNEPITYDASKCPHGCRLSLD